MPLTLLKGLLLGLCCHFWGFANPRRERFCVLSVLSVLCFERFCGKVVVLFC